MAQKKSRRRRKKPSSSHAEMFAVALQPGEVPTDEELEAEAAALEEETQGKYDLAKKDDLSIAKLQHMRHGRVVQAGEEASIEGFARCRSRSWCSRFSSRGPGSRG
jgi:hypothetical protein